MSQPNSKYPEVTFPSDSKYTPANEMFMGAKSENFKGIEFVRISSLPDEQKEKIWTSFHHDKIFKIVKEQSLLNDCILYQDYVSWLEQQHAPSARPAAARTSNRSIFSKLAFK